MGEKPMLRERWISTEETVRELTKMASTLGYTPNVTCALSVKNLKASIDWYSGMLGFQLLYVMDEMGWCELATEVPGVNVGLSQVEDKKTGGGATLTFGVKDIAAARAELEGKGVRFDGDTITIADMVSLATFFDPDGNQLMFFQDLSKK